MSTTKHDRRTNASYETDAYQNQPKGSYTSASFSQTKRTYEIASLVLAEAMPLASADLRATIADMIKGRRSSDMLELWTTAAEGAWLQDAINAVLSTPRGKMIPTATIAAGAVERWNRTMEQRRAMQLT